MSTFEFISVLLSIVVGLGLTRLLSGVGRALEMRRKLRFYWVQGVWILNLGLLFVSFWWATLFGHADRETWLFPNFADSAVSPCARNASRASPVMAGAAPPM